MNLEGLLPIHKPAQMTSHDVVARVRKWSGVRRVGHAGTLDPDVTGVLPLCVGRATRLIEYLQEQPKEYVAVIRFGIATDTQDMSGTIVDKVEHVKLDRSVLQQVSRSFIGPIQQLPPMYSAVKVRGKKLYEWAREGKEVERKPRQVTIHRLEWIDTELNGAHPTATFRVVCSKGTYIRTLCQDLGDALGIPAVMDSLVRTRTGGVSLDNCYPLEAIETAAKQGQLGEWLLPVDRWLTHLPAVTLTQEQAQAALTGRSIVYDAFQQPVLQHDARIRLYTETEQRFIGIFRLDAKSGSIRPVKVFQ